MDRVRLGRVLGRGARLAARTVYDAVDAANAPAPVNSDSRQPRSNRPQASPAKFTPNSQSALLGAVRTVGRVQASARTARTGILAPVKRASRAVSLEITGSFFALFAVSFAAGAWRFRSATSPGVTGHRLWGYLAFALLFGYFAVSSFLRARKISRS